MQHTHRPNNEHISQARLHDLISMINNVKPRERHIKITAYYELTILVQADIFVAVQISVWKCYVISFQWRKRDIHVVRLLFNTSIL